MLDIGWWELMVVGMVALVVVGPGELPALLRTIGRYVGMAKRQADEFRSQFDDAIRESEFNDLRSELDDIKSDLNSNLSDAQESINDGLSETNYDWDEEEPIKPAAEFDGDKETTSFTTPDGEMISKVEPDSGGLADSSSADSANATPAETDAEPGVAPATEDTSIAQDISAEPTENKVASARDAEAVR